MRTKKITNYQDGQLLEIIETTFHDYKMGEVVKVLNSDLYSYHVVNIEGGKRYWWVKENQVKPYEKKSESVPGLAQAFAEQQLAEMMNRR